jgi:hypothetical protein
MRPLATGQPTARERGVAEVVLLVFQVASAGVSAFAFGGAVAVYGGAAADLGADVASLGGQDPGGLVLDPGEGFGLAG